jgi:hypothetical protein
LTVYLAARRESIGSWWAGVAAGLAAAAKYNGGLALVAVLVAAIVRRDPLSERLRRFGLASAGAAAAFLVATPYAVLDLPTFLNSFAAQMGRFASTDLSAEPGWLTYLKYFALSARVWLPYAAVGMVVIAGRRTTRTRWLPALAFAAVYFYVLATRAPVVARYALPLMPIICLFAAAGIDALARLMTSIPGFRRPRVRALAMGVLVLPLLVPFARAVIDWERQFARRDTRQIATDWLKAGLPRGARIAVENSGPTHLAAAGFHVIDVELLIEHPVEWYAERKVEYLIVSSGVAWSGGYADAGVTAVDVPSTPQRPGPAIRIVKIGN